MFRGRRKPGKKWVHSDTLLARALELHEDSICPDCGQCRDETFDPANDADNPARTSEFVVSEPIRDHACTAMSRARKKIADADIAHPGAIRFGLTKVPIVRPKPK